MRQLKQFMALVMVSASLMFNSCSTSDDGGDGGNAPQGILVAKVDGTSYKSWEISSSATVANNGNNLIIIATNSDGNAFSISIFGYEGAGKTYEFDGTTLGPFNTVSYTQTDVNLSNPTASTTKIWSAPYEDAVAGTVSISEETDTHVKGTFSFTAKNTDDDSVITVTEGSFNLNKQTS
ncbi:DUF6252 family protein [Tamlana sp. 62-3]|uniref:DUF6252 family protein n=1 Tax=Neotamlana sargassicola TaxID=2883125 RepID=A0A9X1IBI6_9FLAO|nr:DUF6252 family protein [Tamlana sargassicola]MCB4809596.1 DUF6252 family protein [Tamlana sargassicola]